MITWTLIIFFASPSVGGTVAINSSLTFSTKATCEVAAEVINKAKSKQAYAEPWSVCVEVK